MPKFILVDHSLRGIGGHHFEYALNVVKAAEEAGFEPWLITHRDFRPPSEMPTRWNYRFVYQETYYNRLAFEAGRTSTRKKRHLGFLRHYWGLWKRNRKRVALAEVFAQATEKALQGIELADGDQVVLPTINENDLTGLCLYLAASPASAAANWHAMFHMPLYVGCEPGYPDEDLALDWLRHIYRRAAAMATNRRLHLYTSTETLATQYNRIGIGAFHALPWPHKAIATPGAPSAHAATIAPRAREAPLRIAYLGGARSEKGYQHLPGIVEKLWDQHVATGQARFVIQSAYDFPLPATGANVPVYAAREALGRMPADKISLIDEPNISNRNCDIGLLPYDRSRYHARLSSVLVELLAAGVPALVPAGCWLADQLSDPNRQYHLSLRETQDVVGRTMIRQNAHVTVPDGADHLLLLLRWPVGIQLCTGGYARLDTTFWGAGGKMLETRTTVVGPAIPDRLSTTLMRVAPGTVGATLTWRNAYGPQRLDFRECELCFLGGNPQRALPLGAVGLAAAEISQMPELLSDMIRNFSHYRQTALQFSAEWTAQHNPARVISELLSRAGVERPDDASRSSTVSLPKPHYRAVGSGITPKNMSGA